MTFSQCLIRPSVVLGIPCAPSLEAAPSPLVSAARVVNPSETSRLCPPVLSRAPFSLSFNELRARLAAKDVTPSLADGAAALSLKTKKLEELRLFYPLLNRFCVQDGGQFLEVRFRPTSLQPGEVHASITHRQDKPHDEPPSSYVTIPLVKNGASTRLVIKVPIGWEASEGETVAVRIFNDIPQSIDQTYIHLVQVQSFCSPTVMANTTEVEREALAILADVSDHFNDIVYGSGRATFWLPEMSPEERVAFERHFPDTQEDHPGGNHPLRYAGKIVLRDTDPLLAHIPAADREHCYEMTIGDRTYRYYGLPLSHHPHYAAKIDEMVLALEHASYLPDLPIRFAEYLATLARLLQAGDTFQMMHYQLGYYADLGNKIQNGSLDESDSSIVFWLMWRAWRAAPFTNLFSGVAIRNEAVSVEHRLMLEQGIYENSFEAARKSALRSMSEAVGGEARPNTATRRMATLIAVPTTLGAGFGQFAAVGGMNMYSIIPGREEHALDVILPDGVHGRAVAVKAGLKNLFGSEATTLSLEAIAVLLELLVTRHERGHGDGSGFLHNTSSYKPALEEARADTIALSNVDVFLATGLLTPAMQKAYLQIAIFQYITRFIDTETLKPDGSWNAELFTYGDKGKPHDVGRTFLMRYLLEYQRDGLSGLSFVEETGRRRLAISNLDVLLEASRNFLRDVTVYLNAENHEAGDEAWGNLTQAFQAHRLTAENEIFIHSLKASLRFLATIVRS